MLIGPPGSGKSTLAHHLHQLIPQSCLVSTDQIRQQLYGDPTIQGPWPQIEAVVEAQVRQALDQGQTVIYDATNARRVWRQALLQRLAPLQATWVGWYLTTPLATCLEWNRQRPRAVAPEVIEALYQALKQFPPQAAEGFIALYALDPRQGLDTLADRLQQLGRSSTNRRNRTGHRQVQWHRYSSLLAFDRLLHLISLLGQYPGLGDLHRQDPDQLTSLLGHPPSPDLDSLAEICGVLAQQRGQIYADPAAIAQDLTWLEANGLLSPSPQVTPLTLPPADGPSQDPVNPHAYSDWQPFQRLIGLIRFIAHHPFCWQAETGSSLKSLVSALQQQGGMVGDRQAALRKDMEQILKPYGILPGFRLRRGYFLGSGILSERELLRVASLLQSQVKHIQDPAALSLLSTLQTRLRSSQRDLEQLYPVRAIGNRTIINPDLLPRDAIARHPERLAADIETGQLLELNRFVGVGRFTDPPTGFFQAWPLQIVFHNIAWYLGYEIATGPQAGLLQFERLDRLFRGHSLPKQRPQAAQRQALQRLQRLYLASGGLYLGSDPQQQRQFLNPDPQGRAAATLLLELWFSDRIFAFISEGTQRFPREQMKMSPRLTPNPSPAESLFCLTQSPDLLHPHRFQVQLPLWAREDRDLWRWILGFEDGVRVVAPEVMVEKVKAAAAAISALYKD
jgi:predicted kinase